MRKLILLLAPWLTLPAQTTPPRGWAGDLGQFSRLYQALAEHVDPAVVQVITSGYAVSSEAGTSVVYARRGTGSGVIVDSTGYILTNAHVVGDSRRVQVLLPQKADARMRTGSVLKPGGKLVAAEVLGVDRETDIAVLKIPGEGYPHLELGDSESLRQGQIVFAFGSPYGLENSVTMGIISSVARQVRPDDAMVYIQTDASINPGNSGGPLVDVGGAVVGINTFILSRSGGNEGVGFAAPSNIVKSVYEQIRQLGRVRRGQIGILPQTITPALAEALRLPRDWGVIISDVRSDGPAAAAGLEVNDIVLSAGGQVIDNSRQLGVIIYQSAGKVLELEILRGETTRSLRVSVAERPRDPDRILSLVRGERNRIPKLGVLAVDLDEKVTPLIPAPRKLSGAVVAGIVPRPVPHEDSLQAGDLIYAVNNTPIRGLEDLKAALEPLAHGQTAALYIERLGQLHYLLVEVE